MTTSDQPCALRVDAHLRRLFAHARPDQIRRLLRDIRTSDEDSAQPAPGTA